MRALLRGLIALLGGSAAAIALSMMIRGPAAAIGEVERLSAPVLGGVAGSYGRLPPTIDSELRFYAAMWGTYGVLLLLTAVRRHELAHGTPGLLAAFFVGGCARAMSWAAVGAPHPFFIAMMVIELGLPPILLALWLAARRGPLRP